MSPTITNRFSSDSIPNAHLSGPDTTKYILRVLNPFRLIFILAFKLILDYLLDVLLIHIDTARITYRGGSLAEDTTSASELHRAHGTAADYRGHPGALAHEVNNPLQGILSLTAVLGRECEAGVPSPMRIEQLRSGLKRVARVVESFSVAYDNLPRALDDVSAGRLLEWLQAALAAQQFRAEIGFSADAEMRVVCLGPELARLIADAFALPATEPRTLRVTFAGADGHATLLCERPGPGDESAAWEDLDGAAGFSGIAVLIHEFMTICGGSAAFRWNDAALSGIRLAFAHAWSRPRGKR